jgi:hypothetical protein
MKTTLVVLCFLCATAAFAQTASVIPSTAQPMQMVDHTERASEHAMAPESSLLSVSSYTYARGEQPLSEFVTFKQETPLGDIARAFRKEHAAATSAKPAKVMEN